MSADFTTGNTFETPEFTNVEFDPGIDLKQYDGHYRRMMTWLISGDKFKGINDLVSYGNMIRYSGYVLGFRLGKCKYYLRNINELAITGQTIVNANRFRSVCVDYNGAVMDHFGLHTCVIDYSISLDGRPCNQFSFDVSPGSASAVEFPKCYNVDEHEVARQAAEIPGLGPNGVKLMMAMEHMVHAVDYTELTLERIHKLI